MDSHDSIQSIVKISIFIGAVLGYLVSSFIYGWGIDKFIAFRKKKKDRYITLLRKTHKLMKKNDNIVTLPDLVFETEFTVIECKIFLDKFVMELGGDIQLTDSGKLYYQFPTAKLIAAMENKKEEA